MVVDTAIQNSRFSQKGECRILEPSCAGSTSKHPSPLTECAYRFACAHTVVEQGRMYSAAHTDPEAQLVLLAIGCTSSLQLERTSTYLTNLVLYKYLPMGTGITPSLWLH